MSQATSEHSRGCKMPSPDSKGRCSRMPRDCLRDHEAVRDVVQDTFLKLCSSRIRYD